LPSRASLLALQTHNQTNMNINNAVTKAYEGKSFKEIVNAPVDALQGVSAADAAALKAAFNITTVGDLAKNKFFRWAQSIANLAETEV